MAKTIQLIDTLTTKNRDKLSALYNKLDSVLSAIETLEAKIKNDFASSPEDIDSEFEQGLKCFPKYLSFQYMERELQDLKTTLYIDLPRWASRMLLEGQAREEKKLNNKNNVSRRKEENRSL